MKKFFILIFTVGILFFLYQAVSGSNENKKLGLIFLQVEENGEAWYVNPDDEKRYYLGKPSDAFDIMNKFALGSTHSFLSMKKFPSRLAGKILIDTEKNGEAYYIYPKNLEKYYLGRPADAFRIMSQLGQGISNKSIEKIPIGSIPKNKVTKNSIKKSEILNIPFAAQSPFGEWSDPRQQNGCEEASSLMAVSWAREEELSKEQAKSEIIKASDYLLKKHGEYIDTSTSDTLAWIINDYFNYQSAELKKNISLSDIISELEQGRAVIVPVNGQILKNPNYTGAGPDRHMMVLKGYDAAAKKIITNDPGTRKGESYAYDAKLLYDSIRDYPTGHHKPLTGIEKNMIIISKEK